MGKIRAIAIAFLAVAALQTYRAVKYVFSDKEFSDTLPDKYLGPRRSDDEKEDASIKPFRINITERVLQDLKAKLTEELDSNRVALPLEGVGFQYGFNTDYLKEVAMYWLHEYDWRSREKLLNKFPSFQTKIWGLTIHFQHIQSQSDRKYKKKLPVLVMHGWPASFIQYQKLIPFLTDPDDSDVNFEVVVPSLPGFGFSDGALRPGMGPVQIGQIMIQLMKRLGHEKFYIHGGDWGAHIGNFMTKLYPQNILGFHSTLCISWHPRAYLRMLAATFFPTFMLAPEEQERFHRIAKGFKLHLRELGYLFYQATKPDTVGVGLANSPMGLAAYILEKFSGWTNENIIHFDGGLTNVFEMDELLDNVMIYWVTSSITTSMRIYAEYFRYHYAELESVPVKVPTICLVPPNERFIIQTESMLSETFRNLVSFNYASVGGHFISMEHPDLVAKDLFSIAKFVEEQNNTFI